MKFFIAFILISLSANVLGSTIDYSHCRKYMDSYKSQSYGTPQSVKNGSYFSDWVFDENKGLIFDSGTKTDFVSFKQEGIDAYFMKGNNNIYYKDTVVKRGIEYSLSRMALVKKPNVRSISLSDFKNKFDVLEKFDLAPGPRRSIDYLKFQVNESNKKCVFLKGRISRMDDVKTHYEQINPLLCQRLTGIKVNVVSRCYENALKELKKSCPHSGSCTRERENVLRTQVNKCLDNPSISRGEEIISAYAQERDELFPYLTYYGPQQKIADNILTKQIVLRIIETDCKGQSD